MCGRFKSSGNQTGHNLIKPEIQFREIYIITGSIDRTIRIDRSLSYRARRSTELHQVDQNGPNIDHDRPIDRPFTTRSIDPVF